jgi:hypothetical protein
MCGCVPDDVTDEAQEVGHLYLASVAVMNGYTSNHLEFHHKNNMCGMPMTTPIDVHRCQCVTRWAFFTRRALARHMHRQRDHFTSEKSFIFRPWIQTAR